METGEAWWVPRQSGCAKAPAEPWRADPRAPAVLLWPFRFVAEISPQTHGDEPTPQMIALIRVHVPHRVGDLFLDRLERQQELFRKKLLFPRVACCLRQRGDEQSIGIRRLVPSRRECGAQLIRDIGGQETPVIVRCAGIIGNHHGVKGAEVIGGTTRGRLNRCGGMDILPRRRAPSAKP